METRISIKNPDEAKRSAKDRNRRLTLLIVAIHLIVSGLLMWFLPDEPNPLFTQKLGINMGVFARQFFVVGLFFYALILCMYFFGFPFNESWKVVSGLAAFSFAIALLLSANYTDTSDSSNHDMSFWALIYILLAERQSLLIFFGLATVIVVGGIYYAIRTFVTVEYDGQSGAAGIQLRLPGQTVYYLPIFPQLSWQDTGINVQQGEQLVIDIYGWVSPGIMNIKELEEYNKKFVAEQIKQKETGVPRERRKEEDFPIWPYCKPEGYSDYIYRQSEYKVISEHPLWKLKEYYKETDTLTVKGQTHNKVFGIILPEGLNPKNAKEGPAYDWDKDRDELLMLSRTRKEYPLYITANKTGQLWVVINDDDEARWDNGGMYFLKLTIKAGLLAKR